MGDGPLGVLAAGAINPNLYLSGPFPLPAVSSTGGSLLFCSKEGPIGREDPSGLEMRS